MICFKDRTFCRFAGCESFELCPHSLTDSLKEEAIEWWGSTDYPVCFFSQPPQCYKEKETRRLDEKI
jgi:hypothetical protein